MYTNRIKDLRLSKKLTQTELADMVQIKTSTISAYEIGNRKPSDDVLLKLSEVFEVTPEYILGKTDVPYFSAIYIKEKLQSLRGSLTIEEFAKRLNISPIMLARYEEGIEIPSKIIMEYVEEFDSSVHLSSIRENPVEYSVTGKESFYDKELQEWIDNPSVSREYIEFAYKIYKRGINKDLLNFADINIKV